LALTLLAVAAAIGIVAVALASLARGTRPAT